MQALKRKFSVSLVRQLTVHPVSKTGSILMKLRSHPISGEVASFVSSIKMEKDSSSVESRTVTPAAVFHGDSSLIQRRSPDALTPFQSKSPRVQSSQFYRCPGCDELVNGSQLSEVLLHHQHVLDSYRIRIMREIEAAQATPTPKRRRTADSR